MMSRWAQSIRSQRGATLPLVLIVLLFLTLLGFMAMNTATVELHLAANERNYQQALYIAEAGIAHMRAVLMDQIVPANQTNIASGSPPKWTFALIGPEAGTATTGGFTATLNGYQYHVYVYDNVDASASTSDDEDGLVFVRSDATSPIGTRASIEMLLNASGTSSSLSDYSGQYGGGAGKNFGGKDVNAISDTTTTNMGGL